MTKKYRYASISLLIGLLAFHTFSSCVRTRQILDGRSKVPLHQPFYPRETRFSENVKKFVPLVILVLWTVVVAPALIIASWYMKKNRLAFNATHISNNSFMETTPPPSMLGSKNEPTPKQGLYNHSLMPRDKIDSYDVNLQSAIDQFDHGRLLSFKKRHWLKFLRRQWRAVNGANLYHH